jgi:hypothetical protein
MNFKCVITFLKLGQFYESFENCEVTTLNLFLIDLEHEQVL